MTEGVSIRWEDMLMTGFSIVVLSICFIFGAIILSSFFRWQERRYPQPPQPYQGPPKFDVLPSALVDVHLECGGVVQKVRGIRTVSIGDWSTIFLLEGTLPNGHAVYFQLSSISHFEIMDTGNNSANREQSISGNSRDS
jgi:hypothetical protein